MAKKIRCNRGDFSKVHFSKVERAFSEALLKLHAERLGELAVIADMIHAPGEHSLSPSAERVICTFQEQLLRMKQEDHALYIRLGLSTEQEARLSASPPTFGPEEWRLLHDLKVRLYELQRELRGQEGPTDRCEDHIVAERRRHVYKRFNVREHWLPLR